MDKREIILNGFANQLTHDIIEHLIFLYHKYPELFNYEKYPELFNYERYWSLYDELRVYLDELANALDCDVPSNISNLIQTNVKFNFFLLSIR